MLEEKKSRDMDLAAVIIGCSSSRIFVCVHELVTELQRDVLLAG